MDEDFLFEWVVGLTNTDTFYEYFDPKELQKLEKHLYDIICMSEFLFKN